MIGGDGRQHSAHATGGGGMGLPPWDECDIFCIRGYGGGVGEVCGWRGVWFHASWDATRRVRVCPQCGQSSLMGLPIEGPSPGSRRVP